MIPKMTRVQRSRTVLLLRCAAEVAVTGDYILGPSYETAPRLGIGRRECDLAERAAMRVAAKKAGLVVDGADSCDEYVSTMLEAAIILEEGQWP